MDETGFCEVKKDDESGKLYWVTCDDGSKDGADLDLEKPLIMLPKAFGEGTIIRVYQPKANHAQRT